MSPFQHDALEHWLSTELPTGPFKNGLKTIFTKFEVFLLYFKNKTKIVVGA